MSEADVQEPQQKKQKSGKNPSSPSCILSVQEIETSDRKKVETSIRRFKQDFFLDRPVHDILTINAYENSM